MTKRRRNLDKAAAQPHSRGKSAPRLRSFCPSISASRARSRSVTAWKPYGGMIVLLSETGVPVETFTETEAGIYANNGDPAYFLRMAAGR